MTPRPTYKMLEDGQIVAVLRPIRYDGLDGLEHDGVVVDTMDTGTEDDLFLFSDYQSACHWFWEYQKLRQTHTFMDIEV